MCFLFASVGRVSRISGCVSGGAAAPAPAPAPWSGARISLAELGLDTSTKHTWRVRSVWGGVAPVRLINGSFTSRPSYHDAAVYVISPADEAAARAELL